jgi:hypothetical protein
MKNASEPFFELIAWAWLFKLIFGFGDAISPSGLPKVHLRYRDGRCQLLFGTLPSWVGKGVAELLEEHGIAKAVIKLRKDGRFDFSRSVPEELKQRLRNLVLNR